MILGGETSGLADHILDIGPSSASAGCKNSGEKMIKTVGKTDRLEASGFDSLLGKSIGNVNIISAT